MDFSDLKNKGYHIHLCTPCYNCQMRAEFFLSIMHLQTMAVKCGVNLSVNFLGNESLVQRGRNILTGMFLKGPATHLLFIDADIGFDPATVFKLLAYDKDIVSAIYPKKHIDWNTVRDKAKRGDSELPHAAGLDYNINIIGNKADVVDNHFIPVLDTATGFLMIRRNVLEKMSDHFRESLYCVNDVSSSKDAVPDYVALFDCMIDPETKRYLSEDYAFCRRAQQVGYQIYADVTSPLAHVGSVFLHSDPLQRFKMTPIVDTQNDDEERTLRKSPSFNLEN